MTRITTHADMEAKVDAITENLKNELLTAKAINEKGKTINIGKFNEILDKKIEQLNKLVMETDVDGVTIDSHDANIVFGRVDFLERIKKSGTLDPYSKWLEREEPGIKTSRESKTQKANALKAGIKKLFGKFGTSFTRTPEHNR